MVVAAVRGRAGAVGLAALWLLPLLAEAGRSAGVLAPVATVLTAAPLLLRRRWPRPVLGAVVVLVTASWIALDGRPAFPVVLVLLAVHGVATRVDGPQLWRAVAGTAVLFVALVVVAGVGRGGGPAASGLESPFLLGSLLAGAVLLGVNGRTRRQRVEWLQDRAQRPEAERDQRTRIAVVAERAQIARELHDVVAHSLTVIVRLADGVSAQAATAPGRPLDATALAALSSTGRQALTEMRRLLDVLRVDDAEGQGPDGGAGPGGGTAAGRAGDGEVDRRPHPATGGLDALVQRVRQAGTAVTLTRHGGSTAWSVGTDLAVHRIVQESLTNVLKHAGPGATAWVTVSTEDGRVDVIVEDDGRGEQAVADPGTRGRGLVGMSERAASFGGRLDAGPRARGGWRVHAELAADHTEHADLADHAVQADEVVR